MGLSKDSLQGIVESVKQRYHYRLYLDSIRADIGTYASGNWGHHGLKGQIGGSSKGGGKTNRGSKLKDGTYTSTAKQRKETEKAERAAKKNGTVSKVERTKRIQECRDSMEAYRTLERKLKYIQGGSVRADMLKELRAEASATIVTKANKKLQKCQEELEKWQRLQGTQTRAELEAELDQARKELEEYDKEHPDSTNDRYGPRSNKFYAVERAEKGLEILKNVEDAEQDVRVKEAAQQKAKALLKELKTLDGADSEKLYNELNDERNRVAEEYIGKARAAFKSVDDCETTGDVEAYLRGSGYYRDHGSGCEAIRIINLNGVASDKAIEIGKHIDRMFKDYPMLKRQFNGLSTSELEEGVYAQCGRTEVTVSTRVFGQGNDLEKRYNRDLIYGHHPPNTSPFAIIDHEYTHAIEQNLNMRNYGGERVSDEVMRHVCERLYGRYDENLEFRVQQDVSGYASHNMGTTSGKENYGRNTEFLAEAFSEYRNSPSPRKIAQIVGEELEKIMKERLS